jgi:FlaA1/EpsC-like NDP-sugar epimerase
VLTRSVQLSQTSKALLIVAADVVVLPFALWSAIALRLGQVHFDAGPPWWAYVLTVVVSLPIFLTQGLYRAVIRYMESRAFAAIIGASLSAAVVFAMTIVVLDVAGIPRTALVIYTLLSASYATAARLLARQWLRRVERRGVTRQAVAIYGAGNAGRQLVQALRVSRQYEPVVWIDDAGALQGRNLMGMPVRSSLDLRLLTERYHLQAVIVAIPSLTPGQRSVLLRRLETLGIAVRLVPGLVDLLKGDVGLSDLRHVEPEDLLGRDAVHLDETVLHDFLRGRVVMVTGAGGSIGSELCRQIARFGPAKLVLLDISEFALYSLHEEFVGLHPDLAVVCAIGDVKHHARIAHVVSAYRPSTIFHAAAYKHVPMMEEVNAWEAVRNNAWGTWVVGRSAIDCGVEKVVLVSTDKAVNPTNVMGASKRLAEMVCQGLHSEGRTRFEVVRFGNVLGSSGSVIPKFREQIGAGGPVTVTHPDIVRFFMSIPEAAQLVLQAGGMGQGGEVFVLDMGEPVRIVDLARKMIRLAGFAEDQVPIEFTGLRPGEKLYEELLADSELTRATHHPKIRIAKVAPVPSGWVDALTEWVDANPSLSDDQVRRELSGLLPEYRPWGKSESAALDDEVKPSGLRLVQSS